MCVFEDLDWFHDGHVWAVSLLEDKIYFSIEDDARDKLLPADINEPSGNNNDEEKLEVVFDFILKNDSAFLSSRIAIIQGTCEINDQKFVCTLTLHNGSRIRFSNRSFIEKLEGSVNFICKINLSRLKENEFVLQGNTIDVTATEKRIDFSLVYEPELSHDVELYISLDD